MKVLLILMLQGVLSKVLVDETRCQNEAQRTRYYVYNTNVPIKLYVCLYDPYSQCKNYKILPYEGPNEHILKICHSRLKQPNSQIKITLCEEKGYAEILNNVLVLKSLNLQVPYSAKFIDFEYYSIVWFYSISNLHCIYNGYFSNWTVIENRKRYISNENFTLALERYTRTNWNFDVWKTNYEGIIVSTIDLQTSVNQNSTNWYHKTLLEDCGISTNIQDDLKDSTTTPLETIHVYTCPVKVNVYFCLASATKSCEELGMGESVNNSSLLNRCGYNFFNVSSCIYQNSNVTVCRKFLKVDLKEDKVENISSSCKYSDGLCDTDKAFWQYHDSCRIQVLDKDYRRKDTSGRIEIQFNSTTLFLNNEGRMCGEKVWFTNNPTVVVSERKLQFISESDLRVTKELEYCVHYLNDVVSEQKLNINYIQTSMQYLIFAIIICALWYIFNVTVNFYSLWTLGESKNCIYLFNCVSQSLTNHYLYLNEKCSEKNEMNTLPAPAQLYESVENNLYNEPR